LPLSATSVTALIDAGIFKPSLLAVVTLVRSALNRSKEPSFGGRDEPPIILIEIAWQGGSRNFGPWLDPGDAKARRCRMPPLVETINGAENGAEKSRSLSQL
jgi:hypothetical protein